MWDGAGIDKVTLLQLLTKEYTAGHEARERNEEGILERMEIARAPAVGRGGTGENGLGSCVHEWHGTATATSWMAYMCLGVGHNKPHCRRFFLPTDEATAYVCSS